MSFFEREINIDNFELFEAQKLAGNNRDLFDDFVEAAAVDGTGASMHFNLIAASYLDTNGLITNITGARRVARMATDLFYIGLPDNCKDMRVLDGQDKAGENLYTIWGGVHSGRRYSVVESAWEPKDEEDIGLAVSAYMEGYKSPNQQVAQAVRQRSSRMVRALRRLFRKPEY